MKENKIDKIHHVAIEVKSIKDSITWYKSNSKCEVAYQDDTWALLKYENISLALVLPKSHPPHIAFVRKDAEKYGKLKMHRDGTSSIYIKDPSNNSIEILKLPD
jgi:catechol 2,3-dioxygenase-like lactoylglutathione lyase family enzyme